MNENRSEKMLIETHENNQGLVNFIDMLNLGLNEYDHWFCARIHDPNLKELFHDRGLLFDAEVMMESYLQDIEFHLFFQGEENIYLLSKECSPSSLEGMAYEICDLLLDSHSLSTSVSVYALREQKSGMKFIINTEENLFQIPILRSSRQFGDEISDGMNNKKEIGLNVTRLINTKVLLIEDDRTTRRLVKSALEDNCNIITAQDVSQGLNSFVNYQPNVVFLDIALPDGDGHRALEFMVDKKSDSYVVMFSGHDDQNNVSKAINLGARGFISKPFDKQCMMDHLNKYSQMVA